MSLISLLGLTAVVGLGLYLAFALLKPEWFS